MEHVNHFPETKESLVEKDRKYLWHHVSPYNEQVPPMVVKEAEGSWVTDIDGKKYLDGMAGLWCVNVGYGREELARAAYEQLQTMPYYPLTQSHLPAIHLAEKLNQWLEDEYVIFFSNSGSDANEVAFKLTRQYHQHKGEAHRYKFISRYRAYHGSSMGALSATGQSLRKYMYEPLSGGFLHVRPPDSYRRPQGQSIEEFNLLCAQAIEETINWEAQETIAGVIMEPVITGGGVLIPHPIYMEKVQEICSKYGVLLIIDEVICGFGRTGKAFGHMHYNLKPDIVTMAKGLTSGYLPLSATAVRKDIYDVFKDTASEFHHFRHVNTFGGNPAACALALKNLEIMEQEQLIERSRILGDLLYQGLQELENEACVGDIRYLGFLMGIEIVEDKQTKQPSPAKVAQIVALCKQKGLIIGKNGDTVAGFNNILALSPPLSSTDEDVQFITRTLKEVIKQVA